MFGPSGNPTAENLLGASVYCSGGRAFVCNYAPWP